MKKKKNQSENKKCFKFTTSQFISQFEFVIK